MLYLCTVKTILYVEKRLDIKASKADKLSYFYGKDAAYMNQPGENAQLRRQAIYREYERVLAEKGEDARVIARKAIYERVADNLNYSPGYVRKVIACYLKGNK